MTRTQFSGATQHACMRPLYAPHDTVVTTMQHTPISWIRHPSRVLRMIPMIRLVKAVSHASLHGLAGHAILI